ncbi:MAG: sugar porter family MFS transporter [Candidatus Omnitrophota bacterium]|jgi:sugar porter (SP) family MFS transporter
MPDISGETKSSKSIFVYVVAAIAAIGGILFGFDTGVISGALLFIKKQWALGATSQEFIVSAVLVGAMIGAGLSGKVADKLGRRTTIIITAVIFILGSLGASMAPSVALLIASRIVIGIAIGIASFCVPLYLSEVAPAGQRGALVSLNQLAITIGIVVSYFVDDIFAATGNGWRFMFLVGVLPALFLGAGMLFLPKTPRWLVINGRDDEAGTILKKISSAENVDRDISEMKKNLEEEKVGGFKELFAPWLRIPLIIGIGIMFFQQITGINTVIYYAPTIFQMAGFESDTAAIAATIGVGVLNVAMTVVAIYVIDKIGRKPLLSIGLAGMVIALLALGLAFKEKAYLGDALKWVSVGSLLLYIASFAMSLGPVAWLIIAEIYPLKIRGVAMSIATFSNWAFNFIVAVSFLTIVQALGASTAFWIYAVLGIAGWFFCYFCVPETKGHTLEEIEDHWVQGRSPREL